MRPASAPGDATAKPRVPLGGPIHCCPEPVLVESPLDDALEKETHRVPAPGIHEHQMIKRCQRPTDGARRGGREDGFFVTGAHGSRDDTLAA